ncbi:nicotinamide mononucleotide permease [Penicillium angulare]|uniref:Nicotinamide mononucleotide permease n=1 Tax=Penicillium angulare TaxID=116970 RepID=A0A9W9FWE2_9EURO|nr:nicotinamide mononucleotide permease [Penicillium angulare]
MESTPSSCHAPQIQIETPVNRVDSSKLNVNFPEHDKEILKPVDHAIAVMPESLRQITQEERSNIERRIVRKIDFLILPIIMLLYILNYIDRQNLSAAKLQNIMEDLNMTADQFSTAISILYVGYIPFQIPSNMIIIKVPRPGLYICCAVVAWGVISSCTAAVESYGSLLAVRVILGLVEAVFFPGVIYFLSAWYTKQELGKRLAALFIGQQLGSAFGGLIAAGLLKLNGVHGIQGWRYLFIVEGVATVGIGAIGCFIMPEYPHNTRMLKPIERELAVWRIEQEAGVGEAGEEVSAIQGFVLAMKDVKVWTLVFCIIMSQAMNSALNFLPTIVSTIGYNSTITLVLTAPPYLLACFFFYFISWWSDRKMALYWPTMLCLCAGIVAFVIPCASTSVGARYFAIMLFPIGPQVILYKTLNLHVARPYPKRAAGVALLNALGGTSNVWGSYLWTNSPRFFAGFGMCLGVTIFFMITLTSYKVYINHENKKLNGDEAQIRSLIRSGVTQEQLDMGWRYQGFE